MISVDSKQIQQLYIAYFGRPADPNGINYWLAKSKNGFNLKEIALELSRQDEYIKFIILNRDVDYQINQIYLNLFGRKVDFEGLKYWLFFLEKDKNNISDIIYDLISLNLENIVNKFHITSYDLQVLDNRIHAAQLFTDQLSLSLIWVDLYRPESVNPWIEGKALISGIEFLSHVNFKHRATIETVKISLSKISSMPIEIVHQPVIEMRNISLNIPIYHSDNKNLTSKITKGMLKRVTGGKLRNLNRSTIIEALSNLNLTVMNGERVALVGHNGSGKTSFLKLISGIYKPTKGSLKVDVNVYPMLQKSFLTSTELSGLEAAKAHYLLMKNCLDGYDLFIQDIINFSGLGNYISLPIKTYSEGMCARLIFSILTSIKHECLAIDEGFGTGDAAFFERAEQRMQKFINSAGTLFLASHSEQLLRQFCTRGIVFSQGFIVFDGTLDAALNYYHTYDYSQLCF